MSIRFYDDSLLNKLKNWIKDENLTITGPSETKRLFQYIGDTTNDQPIKLPLIAIRRVSPVRVLSMNKKPLSFDGYRMSANLKKGDQLNAIPIEVNYQIDIYTRYFEEGDDYLRNFVFNIINYPKLKIEIPYNDAKIEHVSNIRMQPELEDNSDIPERLVPGQFTRHTISIYIDDAYLFDYKIKDTLKIETTTDVVLQSDIVDN